MPTVIITKDNIESVITSNPMVVLDFWAAWCGPCRGFAPVFERASNEHGDFVFGKVDTEAEPEVAGAFGITSIPTLVIFREGIGVVDTFVTALAAGDLATLRTSTCGGLAEFYATVDPAKFAEIHELAEQQGSVPVVTSVDKVQITDSHAIVQVTAHPAGTPTDVTERTFDLSEVGGEWKVCGE